MMNDTSNSLTVRGIKGFGLAIRDKEKWRRSSDPYVVIRVGTQVEKTKVAKKTLNPVWNEEITFCIPNANPRLKLEVYDKDVFTKDDKMGDAEIDLQPFADAIQQLRERKISSEAEISKLASKDNGLFNNSCIGYHNGNIIQDVRLKLQHVECGELELQLEWAVAGLK